MGQKNSARFRLRAATGPEHERVDAAFGSFRLSDRAGYTRFLQAQAAAFLPVEAALDRSPAISVVPDWPQRQRGALLRQDLADLGASLPVPLEPGAVPGVETVSGALYVLEGSRLGGRLLARSVGEGLPHRFVGAPDMAGWQTLTGLIDRELQRDQQVEVAISAAIGVFRLFEAAAQQHAEPVAR